MTFIDANIFLTAIVKPVRELEEAKSRACHALFDRLLTGEEQARTHGVIVAEVAYVLGSPKKYRMATAEIVRRIRQLVALPGLRMANKSVLLHALDIWLIFPRLDFEDALIIALIECE